MSETHVEAIERLSKGSCPHCGKPIAYMKVDKEYVLTREEDEDALVPGLSDARGECEGGCHIIYDGKGALFAISWGESR